MRRVALLAALASVLCLSVAAVDASAHSGRGFAAFAQFRDCLKSHGAPALAHRARGTKPSADEVAAWKKAFAACRQLLPVRTAGPHRWARPTPAQVAASKDCMAKHGFALQKPGTGTRPDLRDPTVRAALKSALVACWPLLKPAKSS